MARLPGIADSDTRHDVVNHRREEYMRGDAHTNTVEGAFGLFKRSIVGSFHQISHKHLDRYLDEFEFRFNNRHNPYLFRDTLKKCQIWVSRIHAIRSLRSRAASCRSRAVPPRNASNRARSSYSTLSFRAARGAVGYSG